MLDSKYMYIVPKGVDHSFWKVGWSLIVGKIVNIPQNYWIKYITYNY